MVKPNNRETQSTPEVNFILSDSDHHESLNNTCNVKIMRDHNGISMVRHCPSSQGSYCIAVETNIHTHKMAVCAHV